MENVKQEDTAASNGNNSNGPPSTIKAYQDNQKQQLQSSNYASACQWVCCDVIFDIYLI